jgi:hypothetical protein
LSALASRSSDGLAHIFIVGPHYAAATTWRDFVAIEGSRDLALPPSGRLLDLARDRYAPPPKCDDAALVVR